MTARGNERKAIYRAERDRKHFLELLPLWCERFRLRLPAYVLMDNHYHFLLQTTEANLSPAMQWAPPYHWEQPQRPKERQIREAHETVREQLSQYLVGSVPVCTAQAKVYGIEEWFLPTVLELLDEAHGVALLRCLRAEADAGKVHRIFQQLLAAGRQLGVQLWQAMR